MERKRKIRAKPKHTVVLRHRQDGKSREVEEETEAPLPAVVLRPHQQEARNAFMDGKRNQNLAWHRRAGKDWYGMDLVHSIADKEVGTYWHMLPKHIQAKRAIWNGIDHVSGRRFIELCFPDAVAVNNTDLYIELPSGSTWQLLGSDNYDRHIGSNPRGVLFSEWALSDPSAYDYIRPILRANGGWAIFISTFRGRNHAYQMHQAAKTNPEFFTSLKTIDDTGLITPEQVDLDRKGGMSERLIQQEYYCKPAPPDSLGPYARAFDAVEQSGAVREFPKTSTEGAARYTSVGVFGDYTAVLECAVRNSLHFISGGSIHHNVSLHEAISVRPTRDAETLLLVPEDMRRDVERGLGQPWRRADPASKTETCTFLEQSIIAPTSTLVAALTGSINVKLDEETTNADEATAAVFDALERLAAATSIKRGWGPKPNYSMHDRAVIGGAR